MPPSPHIFRQRAVSYQSSLAQSEDGRDLASGKAAPLPQVSLGSFAHSSLVELVLILSLVRAITSDSLPGRLTEKTPLAVDHILCASEIQNPSSDPETEFCVRTTDLHSFVVTCFLGN